MKIIYKSTNDATEFDLDRFHKSLNKYGEVSKEAIKNALADLHYDPMHYSVLIELGVKLLPDEESARAYYNDHFSENANFERLRRITGYLVGSLERWNDGKKAEEKARVKHSVGQYSQEHKDEIEAIKLENSVMSQF